MSNDSMAKGRKDGTKKDAMAMEQMAKNAVKDGTNKGAMGQGAMPQDDVKQ